MKEIKSLPTSKIERAAKFAGTGVKIGANYVKHYAGKIINPGQDKSELNKNNAEDIFNTLSTMKGSVLKLAQMLSMDKAILPKEYTDKFSLAQFSTPPISAPLINKTIKSSLGKSPSELFESFEPNAMAAASIGQVHRASANGKKLAVKIQYPGVRESISSDIQLVKPFAFKMFGLKEADFAEYVKEVEEKLLEETDYNLELQCGTEIATASAHIPNLKFAKYYPEFSSNRVLTMDWLEGKHMKEFLSTNPSQEVRNQMGQALWDFFDFQINQLQYLHADPHPGNFLFMEDGSVGILDFGCAKKLPQDFYQLFAQLMNPSIITDKPKMEKVLTELNIVYPADSPKTRKLYIDTFTSVINKLAQPFFSEEFDFGDKSYIESVYKMGESLGNIPELRNDKNPRGSKHFIYLNRTYFGLYNLLADLGAKVKTQNRLVES